MTAPVYLGIPTLCRHDLCRQVIDSAFGLSGFPRPTREPSYAIVVDNQGGFTHPDHRVKVMRPCTNLGVAGSWNALGQDTNYGELILSNDDIVFHPDSLARALATPGPMVAMASPAYACFLIRRECWQKVGWFDCHTFFGAYFEDNDHHYRMKLAGLDFRYPDPPWENVIHLGSQTVQGLPTQHANTVRSWASRNGAAYVQKWGGDPGKEVFRSPWNRKCHGCH